MSVIRNKKLLDAARDKSCVYCGATNGTTVACHIQGLRAQEFGKGKGIKPHDLLTADLCAKCHQEFDSYQVSPYDDKYMRQIDTSEIWQNCILKTILRRIEEGLIKLP